MYIEHIHIENFRGIEKIDLDLKQGVNILIGDNGTGKTTILEAMTVALGGYLQGTNTVRGFAQDDFRRSIVKLGGASNSIKYHSPRVAFELNIGGEVFHGERSRGDRSQYGKTQTACSEMQKHAKAAANDEASILPLLCYMSISRVTMTKRSDYGKAAKNKLNDRRSGYIGCMESIIDKTSILEWIKKMSYESFDASELTKVLEHNMNCGNPISEFEGWRGNTDRKEMRELFYKLGDNKTIMFATIG